MDGSHSNPSINLHTERISPDNIVHLFEKHGAAQAQSAQTSKQRLLQGLRKAYWCAGVPLEADYVSIDLDTVDLWVLRALLASPFRPRVLSVEYNCVYGADAVAATVPNDPEARWNGDNTQGASLAAIQMVAGEHGYTLATLVPELDAFLVRDDLLAGVAKPQLVDFYDRAACITVQHQPATAESTARLLDYATWRQTGGNVEAARVALPEKLAAFGIDFSQPGGRLRPVRGLILQPSSLP